jgi:hypothetical protein
MGASLPAGIPQRGQSQSGRRVCFSPHEVQYAGSAMVVTT